MYRLVVIDDEYLVVEGIKAMIARQKLEYEVVGCAYDGIHGLETVRKCQPEVENLEMSTVGRGICQEY